MSYDPAREVWRTECQRGLHRLGSPVLSPWVLHPVSIARPGSPSSQLWPPWLRRPLPTTTPSCVDFPLAQLLVSIFPRPPPPHESASGVVLLPRLQPLRLLPPPSHLPCACRILLSQFCSFFFSCLLQLSCSCYVLVIGQDHRFCKIHNWVPVAWIASLCDYGQCQEARYGLYVFNIIHKARNFVLQSWIKRFPVYEKMLCCCSWRLNKCSCQLRLVQRRCNARPPPYYIPAPHCSPPTPPCCPLPSMS
jgi:hypothetical protein